MRGIAVITSVPGKECHPATGNLANSDRVTRFAPRGVDVDLGHGVEQGVETGAADDADLGDSLGARSLANALGHEATIAAAADTRSRPSKIGRASSRERGSI